MKKPKWVIEKEQASRSETVWLFGLHAVRDALLNPARQKVRLMVTPNAADKLADAITGSGVPAEVIDPRTFKPPIDPGSIHQGVVLEVKPLSWGPLDDVVIGTSTAPPVVLFLDRVTDPHNVGAILRSAEVFGAQAVIAPHRGSAPETGALAKTASGALERLPYIRVKNLAKTMEHLRGMGFLLLGLDGTAEESLEAALAAAPKHPVALVLGAEGPGLREKTKETCDKLVKIAPSQGLGSLNVSNAAAISLYATQRRT